MLNSAYHPGARFDLRVLVNSSRIRDAVKEAHKHDYEEQTPLTAHLGLRRQDADRFTLNTCKSLHQHKCHLLGEVEEAS